MMVSSMICTKSLFTNSEFGLAEYEHVHFSQHKSNQVSRYAHIRYGRIIMNVSHYSISMNFENVPPKIVLDK